MTALIEVTTNEQGSQVVSARELYDYLGFNKAAFARWAKKNIESNPFGRENEDWQGFNIMLNGNEVRDYALKLEFAERLCMLARTEKGEEVRRWFQSVRDAKVKIATTQTPQLSRKELALMVVQIEEEKEALQRQLEEAAPKLDYVDSVLNTEDCMVTTKIATELGYSAMAFNRLLKQRGIQWKVDGSWVLTSRYAGKGYTQMRTHTYYDNGGKMHSTVQMVWTQRGRAMLHYLFKQQAQLQAVS